MRKNIISREIYEKMVECAKKFYPNEGHGFLFKDNTVFECGKAISASVGHFFTDPQYLYDLLKRYGEKPSAVFHSHPCAAIPSMMDLEYMDSMYMMWGEVCWFILSNTYKLRCWIREREIKTEIV